MEKEVAKTVSVIREWINDKLENGCTGEELKVLPELVKSLSELLNSVGRKSNLEERVTVLEEKAAEATTTKLISNSKNLSIIESRVTPIIGIEEIEVVDRIEDPEPLRPYISSMVSDLDEC